MTTEQHEDADMADGKLDERPRLASVDVGEWPGLGGNVSFRVSERMTVLVGRNGAGKSLLVEAIHGATRAAQRMLTTFHAVPGFFQCEVACADGRAYTYRYQLGAPPSRDDEEEARFRPWSEFCRLAGTNTNLWKVEHARLTLDAQTLRNVSSRKTRDDTSVPLAYGEGLVALLMRALGQVDFPVPREAIELRDLFRGTHVVHAGVPRVIEPARGAYRREVLLASTLSPGEVRSWRPLSGPWNRMARLARDIVRMYEKHPEDYKQYCECLGRLGLVEDIEIVFSEEPKPTRAHVDRERLTYAAVLFDGVNIGLCSDGTQRVSEIVLHLLRRDTTLLFIEEPEIAVHPSLLAMLLSLIEAHSQDRQVILSTHAPQIVDWCKPRDLRIVERIEGRTIVSELGEDDLTRIHRYLSLEGTLSEYMYHRGDA